MQLVSFFSFIYFLSNHILFLTEMALNLALETWNQEVRDKAIAIAKGSLKCIMVLIELLITYTKLIFFL
jgi:hypothetical protein